MGNEKQTINIEEGNQLSATNKPYTVIVPTTVPSKITINGQEYQLNAYMSLHDVEELFELPGKRPQVESRLFLSRVIWKSICCSEEVRPSIADIFNQTDLWFDSIITEFLSNQKNLISFYEKQEKNTDPCNRFVAAYKEYWSALSKELAQSCVQALAPLAKMHETIQKNFSNMIDALVESMAHLGNQFTKAYRALYSSELSEEKKEHRRISVCKWGTFGWTFPPWESLAFFDDVPKTLIEADKAMRLYGEKEALHMLWGKIRETRKCKRSDFESAVFLFEKRQYKACALILFSAIDALLVRFQNTCVGGRKVGNQAIKRLKKKIREDPSFEKTILTYTLFFNVVACLEKMYEPYPDFKGCPRVINRNFVVHGMATKPTRKKDCVKLFYLYYNMLVLL